MYKNSAARSPRREACTSTPAARMTSSLSNRPCGLVQCRFFENWACHARRLGLEYLAWPDEPGARDKAASSGACATARAGCTLFFARSLSATYPVNGTESRFRSGNFNRISKFKFVSVLAALRRGSHVWFSNVDIAFIRDPWPEIHAQSAGADYVFQQNRPRHGHEWNFTEGNTAFTGFARVRVCSTCSNPPSMICTWLTG